MVGFFKKLFGKNKAALLDDEEHHAIDLDLSDLDFDTEECITNGLAREKELTPSSIYVDVTEIPVRPYCVEPPVETYAFRDEVPYVYEYTVLQQKSELLDMKMVQNLKEVLFNRIDFYSDTTD